MSTQKTFNEAQHSITRLSLGKLCTSISILGLLLFASYAFLFKRSCDDYRSSFLTPFKFDWLASSNVSEPPTDISHIVFGIVGSVNTWKHKRSYIQAWWRPNQTRGYLFLDEKPKGGLLPWPSSSPPFRVNEELTRFKEYPRMKHRTQVRIVRTVLETIRQGDKDVRWYVMADDDTLLFLDNLVETLAKYDHTKYMYIGSSSECIKSNAYLSFEMAFGGAGYALSSPLAAALESKIDGCIKRHPDLRLSDFALHQCLADFGVDMTHQTGFHQIDLHGDISGFLSAHPQSPLLSLHHLDQIQPIFPMKNRRQSVKHLMKAAKMDHSRILQQTICYDRAKSWSFSIAWGYSVHVYENIFPRNYLRKPLETFRPWGRSRPPLYMFNTRLPSDDPCEAPHVFFLESLKVDTTNNLVLTAYSRSHSRNLPPCSRSGNHSADPITRIQVLSPAAKKEVGKIECCDVVHLANKNTTEVKYRTCKEDEVLA